MAPGSHFLASWLIANARRLGRADMLAVVVAGMAPDLDGLGYPVERLWPSLTWYSSYHHVLGHSLWAALVVAVLVWWWRRNAVVAILAFVAFHVHLLCDMVGSAGFNGEPWPICYLWPVSMQETVCPWQWPLHSPINTAITFALEVAMLVLAVRRGYSPITLVSPAADAYVFKLLKQDRRSGTSAGQRGDSDAP